MVAGDPFKRSGGTDFASQAISYACLNFNAPATPETPSFPTTNCPNGLRAQVFFPSCWDGVNLDSADHKSHMSYPATSYNNGPCPASHPKHLISLFFEVTWQIDQFKDMWYGNSPPFVWASGDPTGYGFHGDFLNGWDVDHLQQAVDQCLSASGQVEDCPVFDLTPDSEAEGCIIPAEVDEPVSGILDHLPGCQTVQYGPGEAIVQYDCGATTSIGNATTQYFTDLTSTMGWSYTGCGRDNYYNRLLTGASEATNSMTVETCVDFCLSKGFTVAGMEYSKECYCADSVPSIGAPIPGVIGGCLMECAGDSSEYCGGPNALSLYQKCTGTCVNSGSGLPASGSGSSTSVASSVSSSKSTVASVASSSISVSPASSSGNTSKAGSSTGTSISLVAVPTKAVSPLPVSIEVESKTSSSTGFSSYSSLTRSTRSVTLSLEGALSSSTTTPSESNSSGDDTVPTSAPDGAEPIPSDATSPGLSPTFSGTPVSQASTFTITKTVPSATGVTLPSGWSYAGCFSDNINPRSLKFWASFVGATMSSTKCTAYCDKLGFKFGGTENAGQCFCGDTLDESEFKDDSECNFACKGASGEKCGGSARLSVFTKVGGSTNGTDSTAWRQRRHLHRHRRSQHSDSLH